MTDTISSYKKSVTGLMLILMSLFFMMFIVVGLCQSILKGSSLSEHDSLLISSSLQAILVFIVPSVITARFESKNPLAELNLNIKPTLLNLVGIILIFSIGNIFLSQIIYYNEHLSLPESLRHLEDMMRNMEDTAGRITESLLSGSTFLDLIIEVVVVGVITGLSEELFFRAGVQRLLGYALHKRWAIWVTAFIFSALHLQFYGFIPRLLIGALFGYLYYWSGSIWVSVIAHALNNSLVVLTTWVDKIYGINLDYSNEVIATKGVPWLAIISGLLTMIVLYKYHKIFFRKGSLKN